MGGIKYRESDSRSIIKLSTCVPKSNLRRGYHFDGLAEEACRLRKLQNWFRSAGLVRSLYPPRYAFFTSGFSSSSREAPAITSRPVSIT